MRLFYKDTSFKFLGANGNEYQEGIEIKSGGDFVELSAIGGEDSRPGMCKMSIPNRDATRASRSILRMIPNLWLVIVTDGNHKFKFKSRVLTLEELDLFFKKHAGSLPDTSDGHLFLSQGSVHIAAKRLALDDLGRDTLLDWGE